MHVKKYFISWIKKNLKSYGSDQEAWALCFYPCMHTVPDQWGKRVKANLYYATRRCFLMFVIAFKF